MKLYRRNDSSRYWCDFWVDGQRYQRSTGHSDRKAADQAARRIVAQVERSIAEKRAGIRRRPAVRVSDAVASWLDAEAAPGRGRSPRYVKSLRSHARLYILPAFGARQMADITRPAIEQWRDGLAEGDRKPATINRILSSLGTFLGWARKRDMIGENPTAGVGALTERPAARHRALTDDEIDAWCRELIEGSPAFLAHNRERGEEHARWVRFLCDTGLREGEGQQLRRRMLDIDRRLVVLPARICKGARSRQVPLTIRALEILAVQIAGIEADALVWGRTSRRTALEAAWTRTELPGRCPSEHDCRHTCASMWIAAGATLAQVQHILGHRSPVTTARYVHRYGAQAADLAALIDSHRGQGGG